MVFSIELADPDVRRALDARRAAAKTTAGDDLEFITAGVAAALGAEAAVAVGLSVDKRTHRLLMELPASPRKGARPQDIIAAVFELEHPAFHLTRERFLFVS